MVRSESCKVASPRPAPLRSARLLSLSSTRAARDGKEGRGGRLEGGAPRAGPVPFPEVGDEEQREVWGGVQSGGRVGETALLRLPALPAGPSAPPSPAAPPRARWRRLWCPSSV